MIFEDFSGFRRFWETFYLDTEAKKDVPERFMEGNAAIFARTDD